MRFEMIKPWSVWCAAFEIDDAAHDALAVMREATAWCRDQFGHGGRDEVWSCNRTCHIVFRDVPSAIAFRLRWC